MLSEMGTWSHEEEEEEEGKNDEIKKTFILKVITVLTSSSMK